MPFHGKLLSLAKDFIPGGSIAGAALDIINRKHGGGGGGGKKARCKAQGGWLDNTKRCRGDFGPNTPGNPVFYLDAAGGGGTGFAPTGPCVFPWRTDPATGECALFLGDQVGADDRPPADAVMGRYGAAYVPGRHVINRSVCLPGDLVGKDGLCYDRKSLTNKERMWPRGRQPLLTGGEMRAISIASRAAGKFERTQKRLQKMGMIKKPAARARAQKMIGPGGPSHHHHE